MMVARLLLCACISFKCVLVAFSQHAWTKLGPSPIEEPLQLSFALRQRNLDKLESIFWQVSDPRSASYSVFKTFDDIKALVGPEAQAVEEVLAFFAEINVSAAISPGGDYVDVDISAGKASLLLSADIQAYQSAQTGLIYHRSLGGFVLPQALVKYVDHVFPLKWLPTLRRKRPSKILGNGLGNVHSVSVDDDNSTWPRDCIGLHKDGMITPGVIRQRYNVTMPSSPRKGSIAVALSYDPDDGCGFLQSDIDERNRLCGIGGQAVQVEVKGDGKSKYCPQTCAKNVGDSCGESNLDVQTVTAIAAGVPAQFWIWKSGDPLDLMKQYNEDKESALVLSCSFIDNEQMFDDDGGKRLEAEFMKAGVMGKTVLFGSGDWGVWAPDDMLQGAEGSHKKFIVGYPASSVYVTAVGGSQFIPRRGGDRGGDEIGPEMGVQTGLNYGDTWVTSGSSGGGVSGLFKVPSYQAAAVSSWYKEAKDAGTLPDASKWANTGSHRGYPDVAVLAGLPGEGKPNKDGSCSGECANYYLRQAGYWTHEDGTSASCPAFAGMIAIMNEHRMANGKPSMGALNTFLYQNPHAFDDITKGDNKYYGNGKDYGGFLATEGWDPVTGLGAPNVGVLIKEALSAVESIISV